MFKFKVKFLQDFKHIKKDTIMELPLRTYQQVVSAGIAEKYTEPKEKKKSKGKDSE